jgi:hypothetical protein
MAHKHTLHTFDAIVICCFVCLQTPALTVVQQFCADAAAWLAAHPHNVVAVHCKAGKGRTGIMICCLMLYLHLNAPALANLPDSNGGADTAATGAAAGVAAGTAADDASCRIAEDSSGSIALAAAPCHTSRTVTADGGSSSSVASSAGIATAAAAAGPSSSWHPWQAVEPLLLQRLPQPPQNVLDLYAVRRTHDLNGVSIPSQRRCAAATWSIV